MRFARSSCLAILALIAAPWLSTAGAAAATLQSEEGVVQVPEPTDKAMRYYRSGNWLWLLNQAWVLLIPALFLFTGFSARIRNWAQRLSRRWFFTIAFYFVIFALLMFLIDLPLAYYQGFVRQHEYGLSNQAFGKWFGDSVKALLVGLTAGVFFLWLPYLLLRKSPRRWWLYTSLMAVPFLCFVMLVAPLWVDPLFNDFGPMQNKELEARILQLAERAGIQGGQVFEVNKSVDTKAVNAYVTGFLGSKRIVLWDTIIAKLNDRQLLVVMGHEMGHFVLGHVVQGLVFSSLLILAALYAAHRLADSLMRRFRDRFGFDQLSDIASLPLILLLVGLFSLVIAPAALSFTRYQEQEADRFALEITRDNYAAATAFVRLQEENLGNPRPGLLYKLWRATHPTIGDRIDFCNEYRPWATGEQLRYGDLFR